MLEKMIIDTAEKLRFASQSIPKVWDGRESILAMKDAGFRYWRQIEWLDFYFKFLCQKHFGSIIDMPGKKYSNTEFNAFREISWDFRVGSVDTEVYSIIANDAKAITDTINDYGYYGIILAIGEVEYDDKERTFKKWENRLTLRKSRYELNRINRGAMSKYHKTGLVLSEIHFICLNSETLNQCSGSFQEGFRNTDSSPRQLKVMINVRKIPNAALVATEIFYGKMPPNECLSAK